MPKNSRAQGLFLKNQLYPILRQNTPTKLIENYPELYTELINLFPRLDTEQKVIKFLKNHKHLYCNEKLGIISQNHIKRTNTTKTRIKTKIIKTKPTIDIACNGIVEKIPVEEDCGGFCHSALAKPDIILFPFSFKYFIFAPALNNICHTYRLQ